MQRDPLMKRERFLVTTILWLRNVIDIGEPVGGREAFVIMADKIIADMGEVSMVDYSEFVAELQQYKPDDSLNVAIVRADKKPPLIHRTILPSANAKTFKTLCGMRGRSMLQVQDLPAGQFEFVTLPAARSALAVSDGDATTFTCKSCQAVWKDITEGKP